MVITSFTLGALDFTALHNGVSSAEFDKDSLLVAASTGESAAQTRSVSRADQRSIRRTKATMHPLHDVLAKRTLSRSVDC